MTPPTRLGSSGTTTSAPLLELARAKVAATLLAECGAEPADIREHVMRMILEQSPGLAAALSRQSWL